MVTLVVVAHPDDEILGFGGAGARLVAAGEVVQPVILCGDVDVRHRRPDDTDLRRDISRANARLGFEPPVLGDFPNIRMNTAPHIDAVQFVEKQIREFRPQRLVTHHPGDLNNDHLQVSRACAAAARLFQRQPDIPALECFAYMEILSSTDWAMPGQAESFQPNSFVEVGDVLEAKLEALSMYRDVMRPYPHPRSPEAIRGLAAYRGGQSGLRMAEAFQVVFRAGL